MENNSVFIEYFTIPFTPGQTNIADNPTFAQSLTYVPTPIVLNLPYELTSGVWEGKIVGAYIWMVMTNLDMQFSTLPRFSTGTTFTPFQRLLINVDQPTNCYSNDGKPSNTWVHLSYGALRTTNTSTPTLNNNWNVTTYQKPTGAESTDSDITIRISNTSALELKMLDENYLPISFGQISSTDWNGISGIAPDVFKFCSSPNTFKGPISGTCGKLYLKMRFDRIINK